eukprot:6200772-Pleurochrysis_carterae.AAC.1
MKQNIAADFKRIRLLIGLHDASSHSDIHQEDISAVSFQHPETFICCQPCACVVKKPNSKLIAAEVKLTDIRWRRRWLWTNYRRKAMHVGGGGQEQQKGGEHAHVRGCSGLCCGRL